MSIGAVTLAAVGVYMLVVLIIGFIAWRRNVKHDAGEYFLADRSLGVFVLTGTLFATWFSTFAFIGGPATFYNSGVHWLLFGFFNVAGPALLWIFGSRLWVLSHRYGFITPSQMVADYYKSEGLRVLVAIISILTLFPYAAIQLSGVAKILETVTDGLVPFQSGVLLVVLAVFVYAFFGGARAVVWTDAFQGFVFALFIIMTAVLTVSWAGGWTTGWEAALQAHPEKFTFPVAGAGAYLTLQLLWTFGWILTPHMWQRVLMARSPRILATSMVLAAPLALWVVTFGGAVVGFLALGLIPELPAGVDADSIVALLYNRFLPMGAVLLAVATFAAGMSTVDSQLLSTSSIFTIDLYQQYVDPSVPERKVQAIGQAFVVVFVLAVLAFTLTPAGGGLLTTLASLGVGFALQFLPCLIGMTYWRRATRQGAFWGLLVGFVVLLVTEFGGLKAALPGTFGGTFWGLVVNVILFTVLSLVTQPDQDSVERYHGYLDEAFARRRPGPQAG